MKELEVVAAVIEYDGKILCMQRGPGKNVETAFKWEFPGGKVDEGETTRQAIIREIQEELEMNIDIEGEFGKFVHSYSEFILNMTCFKCKTLNPNFKMNVHKDYKWLEVSELATLDWAPGDKPVVNKLIEENK